MPVSVRAPSLRWPSQRACAGSTDCRSPREAMPSGSAAAHARDRHRPVRHRRPRRRRWPRPLDAPPPILADMPFPDRLAHLCWCSTNGAGACTGPMRRRRSASCRRFRKQPRRASATSCSCRRCPRSWRPILPRFGSAIGEIQQRLGELLRAGPGRRLYQPRRAGSAVRFLAAKAATARARVHGARPAFVFARSARGRRRTRPPPSPAKAALPTCASTSCRRATRALSSRPRPGGREAKLPPPGFTTTAEGSSCPTNATSTFSTWSRRSST